MIECYEFLPVVSDRMRCVFANVASVKVLELEVFVVDVVLEGGLGHAFCLAARLKGTLVFAPEVVDSPEVDI